MVSRELNVCNEMVIQRGVAELGNGLGDILSRSFNGDVIVLFEVDTGLLLGRVLGNAEEFTLETWVCGPGNVFAVLPLSISVTTSTAAAAATRRAAVPRSAAWLAVC